MRINYHILSSKISDRQTFREYIHGASRYTQLVNTSFIKIKNSIKTALKAILKPRINNVAFSNSKFLTRVLFLFHAKSRNEIKFDDDSTFLIRENVKSKEENTIKIENKNTSSFIVSKIIKSQILKLNEVKDYLNQGKSYAEISRIFNVSKTSVRKFVIKHNLENIKQ